MVGCSGLQYALDIANEPEEDDIQWEASGVRFVTDSHSMTYLEGTTIDYKDTLMDSGFKFENPNSKKSCRV